MADVRMPDGQIVTNVPDDMDPDVLLKNYSSHLAVKPKESSVWEAMKQGAKDAFTPEAITELGKNIPPNAAGRIAAPVRFATGVARIPANLMKLAGVEGPSEFVKAADEGAKNLTESAGYTGGLPAVANLGGEMVLGGAALKGASKLAPVVEALPGGATFVKGLSESPTAQAILGGMGLGAAGSSGTQYDVAKETTLGGIFGLGGQTIASGLGHIAAPVLARYKELKNLGYTDGEILKDTTIGQLLGGKVQTLEKILEAVPFSGVSQAVEKGAKSLKDTLTSKITPIFQREKAAENILDTSLNQFKTAEQRMLDEAKSEAQRKLRVGQTKQSTTLDDAQLAAQRKLEAGQTKQSTALEDAKLAAQRKLETEQAAQAATLKSAQSDVFIPAVNYALKPLNIVIPEGTPGNQAMKIGQTAISDAYNTSLKNFSNLRLTKDVQDDLKSLSKTYNEGYLGKDNASLFKNDIDRLIGETSKGKWLTPDNWQRNLKELSDEAYSMRQKDPRYSNALYKLKDKWMDLIEDQVGSDLFKSANTAFSKFKVPERASAYASSIKAGGEFSPNELVNALRAEMTTKRLAGGEDELQQLAVNAHKKIMGEREALAASQSAAKQGLKDLSVGENRALADIQSSSKQNLKDLYTGKSRALSETQSSAKQNLMDLYSGKGQNLEDKFTGLGSNLAQQKAALQGQAETQAGKQKTAIENITGSAADNSYEGKRIGYALGTGSLIGGYGLSRFGVDPMTSLGVAGSAILGTRGAYSPTVQNWLKQKAIAGRNPQLQKFGESLRANAPVVGATAAQANQNSRQQEDEAPLDTLEVPK